MNTFHQGLLRYLTAEQLQTIQSVRVGIGGAGGLGSNCAMILVRSGFQRLEIIDQDRIDASNLNRQQFFLDEIGQEKTAALGQRLRAINPDLELTLRAEQWTEDNGGEFFQNADYIVEAFDGAEWKYRFVQFYQDRGCPVISGNGMAGLTEKAPLRVRRLGHLYFVGDGRTSSHDGHPPMAPRVTACAALMAEIILDLALGIMRGTET